MDLQSQASIMRILVVEDEPFQRRLLSGVLKSNGFGRISEASSASAAMAMLETEKCNVVVSDLEMPGLNGLELLRQIRSGQTLAPRNIGFIILTSHSHTEVLLSAMALDVDAFIVKPFTTRLVVDKVMRTREHPVCLRSETEYIAVVTDLNTLRSERVLDSTRTDAMLARHADSSQITIPVLELQAGMRLANNLSAGDGTIIIAAETVLTAPLINLICDLKDVVAGRVVRVYVDAAQQ